MSTKTAKKIVHALLIAGFALNFTAGAGFASEGGGGLRAEERAEERALKGKFLNRDIRRNRKQTIKTRYKTPADVKDRRCEQAREWAKLARQAERNGDNWSAKRRWRKAKRAGKDCENW